MGEGVLLGVGEVADQRAARAHREALVVEAQILYAAAEVCAHAFGRDGVGEGLGIGRGGRLRALGIELGKLLTAAHDQLTGGYARQLVRKAHTRVGDLIEVEFAGGDVAEGHARLIFAQADRCDVVLLLFFEHVALEHRARRDDAGDGALHQPLGQRRVGHLFADGDLVALLDQLLHVHVHRVIGHAAHGRALGQAAVLAREGQLQLPGRQLCVVEEHLVEVAQAEEQDGVRILLLHIEILLHHWRHGHWFHLKLIFCWEILQIRGFSGAEAPGSRLSRATCALAGCFCFARRIGRAALPHKSCSHQKPVFDALF